MTRLTHCLLHTLLIRRLHCSLDHSLTPPCPSLFPLLSLPPPILPQPTAAAVVVARSTVWCPKTFSPIPRTRATRACSTGSSRTSSGKPLPCSKRYCIYDGSGVCRYIASSDVFFMMSLYLVQYAIITTLFPPLPLSPSLPLFLSPPPSPSPLLSFPTPDAR